MATPPSVSWPLLVTPDASGRINWPDPEDSIAQCIRVLLQTRPGEQLMRPRFGIGLQEFIGQPDEALTRRRIIDTITNGLGAWEPRIQVAAVEVSDGNEPGWLRVEIHYRIRRTGAPRRLGLTLSLENG